MKRASARGGFTLVEVMVAITIMLVAFLSLMYAFGTYVRIAAANTNTVQASLFAEEGVEAVRLLRDGGYSANIGALANGTNYYLSWNGSGWVATTTPVISDVLYTRRVVFSAVNRDNTTGQIAPAGSGTTLDTNARGVTVSVSWLPAGTSSTSTVSVSTYITNIFAN